MAPPDPLPWRELARWALAGTLVLVTLMLADLSTRGNGNVLTFVQPGQQGPAVAVFREDFPDLDLPGGIGHDGQLFYAIARQPMHPSAVAPDLDRPRYRLQRPLYPWAAWALHPTGGGPGLAWALFAISVLAAALGGVALGAVVASLGGPAWPAALFPLLPGTLAAVRISASDTLATALALAAVAALLRRRHLLAGLAATAAVLTKEPVWLLVAGVVYAAARQAGPSTRTRARVLAVAAAPAVAAAALYVALRFGIDAEGQQVVEFAAPGAGIVDGWDRLVSTDVTAGVTLAATAALAVVAVVRCGWRHPLVPTVMFQLVFTSVLGPDVLTLNYNATRAVLPLLAVSIAALSSREISSPPVVRA